MSLFFSWHFSEKKWHFLSTKMVLFWHKIGIICTCNDPEATCQLSQHSIWSFCNDKLWFMMILHQIWVGFSTSVTLFCKSMHFPYKILIHFQNVTKKIKSDIFQKSKKSDIYKKNSDKKHYDTSRQSVGKRTA